MRLVSRVFQFVNCDWLQDLIPNFFQVYERGWCETPLRSENEGLPGNELDIVQQVVCSVWPSFVVLIIISSSHSCMFSWNFKHTYSEYDTGKLWSASEANASISNGPPVNSFGPSFNFNLQELMVFHFFVILQVLNYIFTVICSYSIKWYYRTVFLFVVRILYKI